MSDPVVDAALFRVRAFEQDWSRMLSSLFQRTRFSPDPGRYGGMAAVLAAEADGWFRAGSENGYFRGADSLALRFEALDPSEYETEIDAASYFLPFHISLEADEFGEQLNLAREDLTYPRVEFLSLLMFASDANWNRRIEELEVFADALEEQPLWQPPPDALSMVAWSLQGAESRRGWQRLPGEWRLGDMDDYFLGPQPWRVKERWQPLTAQRERIRRAVEATAEVQAALPGEDLSLLWKVRRGDEG